MPDAGKVVKRVGRTAGKIAGAVGDAAGGAVKAVGKALQIGDDRKRKARRSSTSS